MDRFFNLVLYRNEGRYRNPLLHPFLLITLVFGLCFVFFPGVSGAEQSILFKLTQVVFDNWLTSAWGIAALLTYVLNWVAWVVKFRWVGKATATLGFMVWTYALVIYIAGGFWLGVLGFAIPNMWFWVWYYLAIRTYDIDREAGRV